MSFTGSLADAKAKGWNQSIHCKLSQEGRLRSQKVGRHWRFREDTLDRSLEQMLPDVGMWRGEGE